MNNKYPKEALVFEDSEGCICELVSEIYVFGAKDYPLAQFVKVNRVIQLEDIYVYRFLDLEPSLRPMTPAARDFLAAFGL